jgi:hypothetical protein
MLDRFVYLLRVPTAMALRSGKARTGAHLTHLTVKMSNALFISTMSMYHTRKRIDVYPTASTGSMPDKTRIEKKNDSTL